MSTSFGAKKSRILQQLEVPDSEYNDLSLKGSIDEGIRELIDEINIISTIVTTSSCAGRVSVYLEGQRKSESAFGEGVESGIAGTGGKGGGKWLYVSHDAVESEEHKGKLSILYGLRAPEDLSVPRPKSSRLIHFKFEAMILHMLVASLADASKILSAASAAGFRESGAMNLTPAKDGSFTPMVAVRSNGLSFDSIVGYLDSNGEPRSLVTEDHLRMLTDIANERFQVNSERIARFRTDLLSILSSEDVSEKATDWEDTEVRRTRKRAEGLARREAAR